MEANSKTYRIYPTRDIVGLAPLERLVTGVLSILPDGRSIITEGGDIVLIAPSDAFIVEVKQTTNEQGNN